MTLYRRQGSRPSPWERNAKKQNGCLFYRTQMAGRFRRCEIGTCDMIFALGKVDVGNTQVRRPVRE